jgi:HEAT repeat protein
MLQQDSGGTAALQQAFGETEPAARIAGANAVALAIRRDLADAASIARFHGEHLPDLMTTALGGGDRNLRYRAVFALVRAGTDEAAAVLGSIAAHGDREIAALAARGLSQYSHFQDSNR